MAKKPLKNVWNFLMWLVGILVTLAVGFGMVSGTLGIRFIPSIVTIVTGWIVIAMGLIAVLVWIVDKLK